MKGLINNFLYKTRNDKFLSNSFIFFVGSMIASAGNYLFHFLMARMLSVAQYGELQSLLAASIIVGVPTATLLTVLVKYTAHFKAKQESGKIHSLLLIFNKKIGLAGALFFVLFFIFRNYIADFLNLSSSVPVLILGVSFIPSFLGAVNMGVVQGLEKFKGASIIGIIGVAIKIIIATLLVKVGFAINGAIGAIALSAVVGYFISFLPIKFLFKKVKTEIETREISQFFAPTFFIFLFIALLSNIDVILVKHFLPPGLAGQYGALAVVGHIIFFVGGPIASVMFPMTASAFASGGHSNYILKKAFILMGLVGTGVLLFYFFIPQIIIRILVGSKFLPISNILGWFGMAMIFYSLINLLAKYLLSIHKTKCLYLLGLGVFLQIILISAWHNSLFQITLMMNITMLFTLFLLLIYYFIVCKTKLSQL